MLILNICRLGNGDLYCGDDRRDGRGSRGGVWGGGGGFGGRLLGWGGPGVEGRSAEMSGSDEWYVVS